MQSSKLIFLAITIFLLAVLLVGCSSPTPIVIVVTATPAPDLIATDVARQRAVAATLTAEAPKPLPTPVVPPTAVVPPTPVPSATPIPSATPVPTATRLPPTPTLAPNRIRNFQPMELPYQGQQRLQVTVEYFYNGEWGTDKIFMTATAWNDKAQITEIYPDRQPITPGEGFVQMELILHDTGMYITSRIQICMFAEGTVPRIYCQFYPYAKTWKK